MEENKLGYLNEQAMQIILYAGNARTIINNTIDSILEEDTQYRKRLEEAHEELVKAHKIQTKVIQSTIDDCEYQTTLLFTHAQDTLMTVNSEYNITRNIIKLYEKVSK